MMTDDSKQTCRRFRVSKERQASWVAKTFDLYEVCKLCLGSSCLLNNLLRRNGYKVKSSSGLQAIRWARSGDWQSLEDYCMDDAMLTHSISSASRVILPLTGWPETVVVECVRETNEAENEKTPCCSERDQAKRRLGHHHHNHPRIQILRVVSS
jgi:hypothetical protein